MKKKILSIVDFSHQHACLLNQSIDAVNTIIRRPNDGKLVGYNTDCEAAITSIEDALKVLPYTDFLFPYKLCSGPI